MKVLKIGFVGTRTDRPEAMVDFFERTLALRPMHGGDDTWAFRLPDGSIAEVFGPSRNDHLTTGPVVEFQVEDVVWDQVIADLPGEQLDRDLPQRVLGTFCRDEGIPCLDLLPRFRALPPIEDGTKHLYSLRDSHWNRRGNAEAGAALAEFLQPLLAR